MNRKFVPAFCACLFLFTRISIAQSSVNVNPLTGTGSVVIPIYTFNSGQVTLPLNLVYSGTGVKPKDVEGTAGMNWQLESFQISRQVRGLPDDCTKDSIGNQRLGWMSPLDTAANKISAFTIANDGGVTCSKETADISYINANFPFRNDTEPDRFYVSAPGLSCELIYNRDSLKFKPVNYQDLVITYTTVGGTGHNASNIASFTITNDKGIKYIFSTPEWVSEITFDGITNPYFATKYNQYLHGINYYDSWSLTSINDPNGNGVYLYYSSSLPRMGADSVSLYSPGTTTPVRQYYILTTVQSPTLDGIASTNRGYANSLLTITWTTFTGSSLTNQTAVSSITGMGRNFQFTYSPTVYTPTGYTRNFLRNFTDVGCSTPINYTFGYIGETKTGTYAYTTTLPDSTSGAVDYWGYYTNSVTGLMPKVWISGNTTGIPPYAIYETGTGGFDTYPYYTTNGGVRSAGSSGLGALNKITYAQGGSTNLVYESNDYADGPSGVVIQGGGIRVKQIIDSVANGSTNNIIRNYSYLNPSTGVSSGKPLSMLQFAFTIPYSGGAGGNTLWNLNTIVSNYDLSNEDHTIMYGYCKVSQTGAGSTLYQYYVPAGAWDYSATPACSGCSTADWAPTVNYVARNNCSSTYGPIKNAAYNYPFIPNPNYDFERGLLQKVTSYNENTTPQEVSETNYTYQRSFTPTAITAFKFEDDPNGSLLIKSYDKYTIFCNTSELPYTVTKKVFDSSNNGTSQSSATTYTYGSANHKLLTQQAATNSDGSTVNTYYRYIKDYPSAAGSNANVNALYYLRQQNINAPVETYQQVVRGSTIVTTSASLTLFQGVAIGSGITLYLPSQQLKIVQPDGASTFTPYNVVGTVPQSSTPDANYFPVANFDTYDNAGYPVTVDDAHKHIQTTIFDHLTNHPTAVFKNTYSFEVAFNDFDTQPSSPTAGYGLIGFTLSDTVIYYPVGSHTGKAFGVAAGQTETSGNLLRNAVAQNYIFSIWINAAAPGRLTLTLPGSTAADTIHYSGGWKYYELKRPKSTSAIYTVSFTTTQNISIDDILFYPDVAEAGTAAYDAVTHYKTAQTNTNGVSAYLASDQWGRVLYAYDQDKNIVQKNSYVTPADIASINTAIISPTPSFVLNQHAVSFTVSWPGTCSTTVSGVAWKFGDGTTGTSSGLTSPSHTYTVPGTDTVTATVTSPLYGALVVKSLVAVNPNNIAVTYSTGLPPGTGGLTTVNFMQGGVSKYSFTNSTLNGATVAQGVYTIVVTITNPTNTTAYSIALTADCWSGCSNYTTGTTTYSFSANLNTCSTLAFYMSPSHCP